MCFVYTCICVHALPCILVCVCSLVVFSEIADAAARLISFAFLLCLSPAFPFFFFAIFLFIFFLHSPLCHYFIHPLLFFLFTVVSSFFHSILSSSFFALLLLPLCLFSFSHFMVIYKKRFIPIVTFKTEDVLCTEYILPLNIDEKLYSSWCGMVRSWSTLLFVVIGLPVLYYGVM